MLALEAAERWPRAAEKAESLTGERHFEKDARLFVRRRDFAAVRRRQSLAGENFEKDVRLEARKGEASLAWW